jgi:hypothetical protein
MISNHSLAKVGYANAHNFAYSPSPVSFLKPQTSVDPPTKKGKVYLYPMTHDEEFINTQSLSRNDSDTDTSQGNILREFFRRRAQHIVVEGWTRPAIHLNGSELDFEKNAENRDENCAFLDGASSDFDKNSFAIEGDGAWAVSAYCHFTEFPLTLYPYATPETDQAGTLAMQHQAKFANMLPALSKEIEDGIANYENASTHEELAKKQEWENCIKAKSSLINENLKKAMQVSDKYICENREKDWAYHISDLNKKMPDIDIHVPLGAFHAKAVYALLTAENPNIPVEILDIPSA